MLPHENRLGGFILVFLLHMTWKRIFGNT